MALDKNVIDIPLGNVDQSTTKHHNPVGQLIKLVNGEIVQYSPAAPGGKPQYNTIRQRKGFASYTTDVRSAVDASVIADDAHTPRLLAPIGDQLVRIVHSKPEVFGDNNAWIRHDKLVLTEQLSQQVVHTSTRTIQAPDSAWVGNVECVTWIETDIGTDVQTAYVGFRDAEGAWLVLPRVRFVGGASVRVLARVVTDGRWFWVFTGTPSADNIQAYVYDTNGVFRAQNGLLRQCLASPGFWDITATPQTVGGQASTVLLAQPNGNPTGADVNVQLTGFAYDGVSTVSLSTVVLTTPDCSGRLAWLSSNRNDGIAYLGVIGTVSGGNALPKAYEITNGAVTRSYATTSPTMLVPEGRVDAITGYALANGDIGLSVSLLANGPFGAGPTYDPALRAVVTWKITASNVASLVGMHNGVLLQSRAFQVDDDWYAVTYYQSGPGRLRAGTSAGLALAGGDYMTGQAVQTLQATPGDSINGSAHIINSAGCIMMNTISETIAVNAGTDGVVSTTATWTFSNGAFPNDLNAEPNALTFVDATLTITGATPSSLNTTWRVISRPSSTTLITDVVGGNGTALVNTTGPPATAVLTGKMVFVIPVNYGANGRSIGTDIAPLFIGGTVTVSGASIGGDNTTFTIENIVQDYAFANGIYTDATKIVCTPVGGATGERLPATATLSLAPKTPVNDWRMAAAGFNAVDVGNQITITGIDVGAETITSVVVGVSAVTNGFLLPVILGGGEICQILQPNPYKFFLQNAAFDSSWIGSIIVVSGSPVAANNGSYVIRSVINSHTVITVPATGITGQRNDSLATDGSAVGLIKATSPGSSLQPCWFISPLSKDQQTAGRFDYGIAFADWRFDAETTPNYFPLALASVTQRVVIGQTIEPIGLNVSLPYRAQSFTGDQVVKIDGNPLALQAVLQTTVGIKDFFISVQPGQAVNSAGTMLIPGPRASQFSLSGFGEQSVNLAFEKPYLVSQSSNAGYTGLIPGVPYQVIFVAECTDENGDHVYSLPSLALDFTLTGTNNTATYGCRLIGPTDRVVAVNIYRTATLDGIPTTQHYRITNPLDVNGTGFAFVAWGYGYTGKPDSLLFVDTISDTAARAGEVLYTDKGYLARYPAPAFKQGAIWRNRAFLIGYDGAIWMSGEKTDGDSLWFHPALRFVLPTANTPVAVAPMDDYLIVLCGEGQQSYWYIPAANFPDGTGQNGTLPNPAALQFQGSCAGFALGTRNGVVYNNTAGGLWLITRNLTNVWLSESIKTDLNADSVVTGLSIDNSQRLYASNDAGQLFVFDQISNTWWQWDVPAPVSLLTTFQGKPTYQDALYTMQQADFHMDLRGTDITGCPPYYDFADLDFAGVRSFKTLWEMQLLGTYKGPHNINVELSYPDEISQVPTEFSWTPSANEEFIFSFNPQVEESSTYHVKVWVDFDGVLEPGDSFEFEMLAAECGVDRGMNKLPGSQQKTAK